MPVRFLCGLIRKSNMDSLTVAEWSGILARLLSGGRSQCWLLVRGEWYGVKCIADLMALVATGAVLHPEMSATELFRINASL